MGHVEKTISYYNEHAGEYTAETEHVDISNLQLAFTCMLPKGGRILDLGCGSGRDALAFAKAGFQVDAVDGSAAMCREARRVTGLPVSCCTFGQFIPVETYDGVWACSSLLHLNRTELPFIIGKYAQTLRPGGVFYMSFKLGTFQGMRHDRWFTDMTEEMFWELIDEIPQLQIGRIRITSDVRPDHDGEKWLNGWCIRKAEPEDTSKASGFPVVSVDTMRASDQYTIRQYVGEGELMGRAGRSIASLVTSSGPYCVVCGPGNNGGDGYVVARCLALRDRVNGRLGDVTVLCTKPPASEAARYHRRLLEAAGIPVITFQEGNELTGFSTIVDCLLGTGFQGTPRGLVAEAIKAINRAKMRGSVVVSADINSGVDGDTGQGELAVFSDLTVSLGFLKKGMLAPSMEAWATRIVNADIGIRLWGEPELVVESSDLPPWIDPEEVSCS